MKPSVLDKIVVPLDGSSLAECALPIALALLSTAEGRLLLLRVPVYAETPPPVAAEYNMYWPEMRDATSSYRQVYQETQDYLAHIANRCQRKGLTVDTRVEEGDRAGAIVDVARAAQADLIVMTTHGRTGVSRWVIGSVTERVLHDAPCPVLAVRARPDCGPDRPSPQFAERILVPLDGSPLSETALPPAMAIAKRLGGKIILLRVAQGPANGPSAEGETSADAEEAPGAYLLEVAEACRAEDVATDTVTVTQPGSGAAHVAGAILDYAASEGIGLIAMSTHGRSGLQRWVYGSVTEKVLHNSDGALLIVRP